MSQLDDETAAAFERLAARCLDEGWAFAAHMVSVARVAAENAAQEKQVSLNAAHVPDWSLRMSFGDR